MRPADKAAAIETLQESRSSRLRMAGDGINDAPALARAMWASLQGDVPTIASGSAQVTLVKRLARMVDVAHRHLERAHISTGQGGRIVDAIAPPSATRVTCFLERLDRSRFIGGAHVRNDLIEWVVRPPRHRPLVRAIAREDHQAQARAFNA